MAKRKRKIDRRLLGTWKSDRRKTFAEFRPKKNADPKALRKLKAIFGKLKLHWTRTNVHSNYDGFSESQTYDVLASDSQSVVIRIYENLFEEYELKQMFFEGTEYYWVYVGGNLREYFKRIK